MEAEGPEWKAYVTAQGTRTRAVLDAIPGRDALQAAVATYDGEVVAVQAVQVGGPYVFTQVRPAAANTFKLYVREGVNGRDRLLVDPDVYAQAGSHASLDWWACSPDGTHVVFGSSPGGSENSTARIIVTATGALLPETIDRTENASPSWTPDGSGFFYNRLQAGVSPDGTDKYKLSAGWLHRLDTDPAHDVKVLAEGSSPVVVATETDFPIVIATPGSQVVIGVIVSGVQNEVAIYAARLSDVAAGAPDWKPVCTPADKVTAAAVLGEELYLLSHQGAPRYQVIKVHASDPAVARGRGRGAGERFGHPRDRGGARRRLPAGPERRPRRPAAARQGWIDRRRRHALRRRDRRAQHRHPA